MDPLTVRVAVLAAVLALALAVGLWRRRRDGRVVEVVGGDVVDAVAVGGRLGDQATLLQFSSAVCSQCAGARRILREIAAGAPGVLHVEVDAARHLDLARQLDIMRTPTVLVLDRAGRVVHRASGAPSTAAVRGALVAVAEATG